MANRPITEKEKMAWDFAKQAHKGQIRKFINKPYFGAHVVKVNGIVKQYTTDEDLLCAALLHDTLEDCYEDPDVGLVELKEILGNRVGNLVWELTSDGDEIDDDYEGSKTNYLIDKMIHMSDDALIIKLADRLQNISDAFTTTERFRTKYFLETSNIIEVLKSHRRFNRIQSLLLADIESKLDNIESLFRIKRFNEF